jgi:hypothetical protein
VSYVRRNLAPLLVGLAAIVAIIGGGAVVASQLSDDGDDSEVTRGRDDGAPRFAFEGLDDLNRLLGRGILLGISLASDVDGLVVDEVILGSPADEAGLRPRDAILEVNGEPVDDLDALREAIEDVEPGDHYELTIEREGDRHTLTVERRELAVERFFDELPFRGLDRDLDLPPTLPGRDRGRPDLAQPRTPDSDEFFSLRLRPTLGVSVVQTAEGLQVVDVVAGSAAERAGVEGGDIIESVDGDPVDSIGELRAALPTFELDEPPADDAELGSVTLGVFRGGRQIRIDVVFAAAALGALPSFGLELPADLPPSLDPDALEALLEEWRAYLESDEFADRLARRMFDRLDALEAPTTDRADESDTAELPLDLAALGTLEVYTGRIETVGEGRIVLTGARGSIGFTLTEQTIYVGAEPLAGAAVGIAVDADRNAVLVLVAG